MNASDYIQLGLAVIAAIGVILSLYNIRLTNKQIKSQHKQWMYSYKPQFRFKYMDPKVTKPFFVFEETSGNPYYISDVTFTTEDVKVIETFHGAVGQKVIWEDDNATQITEEKHDGFIVLLEPLHSRLISGYIQITGKDALGNVFRRNSNLIKFQNKRLANHLQITKTFLNEK